MASIDGDDRQSLYVLLSIEVPLIIAAKYLVNFFIGDVYRVSHLNYLSLPPLAVVGLICSTVMGLILSCISFIPASGPWPNTYLIQSMTSIIAVSECFTFVMVT
jgi:hypothetical protein